VAIFEHIIGTVNDVIWSNAVIVILSVLAIGFTIMTKGLQFRRIPSMFKHLTEKNDQTEKGLNAFQSLATTVGSRVGTGNIAGVATAIFFGGPGAIVIMWITAIFGASTGIIECILGQAYKNKSGGELVGGPAYYMERGLHKRGLGILYAFATFIGTFLLAAVQTYTSASSVEGAFPAVKPVGTGIIITILVAVVVIGGITRIGKVAEVLAPFMTAVYFAIGLIILIVNINKLPGVLALMFRCAFTKDAVFGGILGSTITWGIKRGFFSNDAGNGMAPMVSSTAETSHPVKQGLIQGLSVYIDTLLVCTITGMSILLAGTYSVSANGVDMSSLVVDYAPGIKYGILYMQKAMTDTIGSFGGPLLAIIITVFVYTTLLSYAYEIESSIHFLCGNNRKIIIAMRVLFLGACFFGSFIEGGVVWDMGDTGVGIMTWVNVFAVALLAPVALRIIRDYEKQRKAGLDPIFDPDTVGIQDEAGVWNQYVQKKKKRGDYENDTLGYQKGAVGK
jgi:AGCS family alanine or glycine:cation symporter